MNEFNCDDKKYKFLSNSKVSIYTDIVGQEDDLWIIEAVIIPIALYDNIEICMNSQNVIRVSYQTKIVTTLADSPPNPDDIGIPFLIKTSTPNSLFVKLIKSLIAN